MGESRERLTKRSPFIGERCFCDGYAPTNIPAAAEKTVVQGSLKALMSARRYTRRTIVSYIGQALYGPGGRISQVFLLSFNIIICFQTSWPVK